MSQSSTLEKRKERAAQLSMLAAVFLSSLKLIVALATGSLAILSEALHSILDLAASCITWMAVRSARRPADDFHTFGHARIENLSAMAESILLLVVSFFVISEGCERLFSSQPQVQPGFIALLLMAFSLVIDIRRAKSLKAIAKESQSQALDADAMHFSTDILSTTAVLVGLLLVNIADIVPVDAKIRAVLLHADTIAAFAVALIILVVSLRMIFRSCQILLDGCPVALQEKIRSVILTADDVLKISRMRIRSSGATYFVDLAICIEGTKSVQDGHAICQSVEQKILSLLPTADITIHVDPIQEYAC